MNKEELIKNIREEVKPKKLFGQNFLINPKIYEKIIETAEIQEGEKVLEVGAGTGVLTRYLIDAGADVIAVEKDRDLIKRLENNAPEAEIILGDILKTDIDIEGEYKIVANIPYYLTSRLIKTIFEKWPKPKLVVLMVQHEIAKRITAKPPDMSMLSLSVQYYAEPKIIAKVRKGSFWPMPEVDSAILKIVPRADASPNKDLFTLAKKAFSGKRKKLGNTLKPHKEILEKAGIDPNRRPETLTPREWLKLADSL
jgi:16S rRNA (adenine1518-N6/adenine1519-N6)-dimethyltransferase